LSSEGSSYKAVIRIAGVDLPGNVKVGYALPKIRGVGRSFSNAVLRGAGVNPDAPTGQLTDEEVSRIEDALREPGKYGIPSWLFNRQKDPFIGKSVHVVGPDLLIQLRKDVETMMKLKSWKGVRHALGLKVRGQRTRTTGRLGQTVGVKRKAIQQQQQQQLQQK
jgi:small subunit ribosomal protein S13